MRIIVDFILDRLNELKILIKDILFFDENGEFFHKFFYSISNDLQNFLSTNVSLLYKTWIIYYNLYPECIISLTGLIILLGPYVIWVTTNILFLLIIFLWYFTIYSYNFLLEKKIDIIIGDLILAYIIKFKYFINLLQIFKFIYILLFDFLFFIINHLNYTKNSKYNYDMYGNPLILIKKSSIFLFKNILYINMYLDSFYYQTKLKLDWRSILTFHIDENENEDPEDYEQIILWPLLRFKYKSYFFKMFEVISKYKYSSFNRFAKRRRFNFVYKIKKSFIYYFFINIKKLLILLFIISFFNIIILNIIFKILKYIFTL
jgi:hypothetical protein